MDLLDRIEAVTPTGEPLGVECLHSRGAQSMPDRTVEAARRWESTAGPATMRWQYASYAISRWLLSSRSEGGVDSWRFTVESSVGSWSSPFPFGACHDVVTPFAGRCPWTHACCLAFRAGKTRQDLRRRAGTAERR